MALEDNVPQGQSNDLDDEEERDLQIAVLMGQELLEQGGMQVIDEAIDTSSDPAQVLGQFFIQMIQQLDESMPAEMALSKRIYLAQGGWLEQMMDFLVEEMGIERKITDRAEIFAAQAITQMAQAGQQQAQQQAAPAPPMPQGAM